MFGIKIPEINKLLRLLLKMKGKAIWHLKQIVIESNGFQKNY